MRLYFLGLLFILQFLATNSYAQQLPADLSSVRASQISDVQLQRLVDQANSSDVSLEEVESEMLRRGLPPSELEILKQRLELLGLRAGGSTTSKSASTDSLGVNNSTKARKVNRPSKELQSLFLEDEKKLRLFGTELFENSNLTFEPDLRMATPAGYVIGPDDELLLNIYGLNVSQQTLKVSPEGTVNIKYAGVTSVTGLSIEAATSLIKSKLLKFYPSLSNGATKLQLSLGNIRSIRVILIGAIKRPGTYTLPSLATLFNALYVSGGPTENGSFRTIELIRNNKVIQVADLYDFLIKGDLGSNVRLQDNDVIRIPFAKNLVTLKGQLNRPGIFELLPKDRLSDAIDFAGGFRSKAFKGRITGTRILDFSRSIVDVAGDSISYFVPRNGDEFVIDSVINRFNNRVMITGAVFKPGAYALEQGMSLVALIQKAQGVKEDVFDGTAFLIRTRPNLTKEYINIGLKDVLTGRDPGITLVKDDSVHVASIFDLKDSITVTINGAVRKPGTFRFEDSLSLKALIMKAGGYADNATGLGIEISRRKRDVEVNQPKSKIVELITVNADRSLNDISSDLILMPFDIVTIKEDPFYKKQISIKITGEVLMPSIYTLENREERLSSIIKRSGGLLYTANIQGAKLIRKKKEQLDSVELKRLISSVQMDTTISTQDSLALLKDTRDVAIDLDYILKHPGSADDITLEDGDELIIPRINNTVSINGEVFKPLDIMFEKGKSMRQYIDDAGGVTPQGSRRRAFMIYANGSAAKVKHPFGIFSRYPKVEPGATIFIPQRPKRDGIDVGKAGIFISAITALITAAALLTR
ncbi:MAG: SLBB domain-containing protein [Flavipsychrobacter sp.]|nr:SLBB domain-containing protein [Flavipsychrobacter sp.]